MYVEPLRDSMVRRVRPALILLLGSISAGLPAYGLVLVVAFGLGMAVFTMVMGNAFAAFPVMAAAIGVPLLIQADGGNPAVVGAIGMLAGFCGTLMTPMAASIPWTVECGKNSPRMPVRKMPFSLLKRACGQIRRNETSSLTPSSPMPGPSQ